MAHSWLERLLDLDLEDLGSITAWSLRNNARKKNKNFGWSTIDNY